MGAISSRVGLVMEMAPHSSPNSAQSRARCASAARPPVPRILMPSTSTAAKIMVERDISHTHFTPYCMIPG